MSSRVSQGGPRGRKGVAEIGPPYSICRHACPRLDKNGRGSTVHIVIEYGGTPDILYLHTTQPASQPYRGRDESSVRARARDQKSLTD